MPEPDPTIVASSDVSGHHVEVYEQALVCVRVQGDVALGDVEAARGFVRDYVRSHTVSLVVDISQLNHIDSRAIQQARSLTFRCVAVVVGGFGQRSLYPMKTRLFGAEPNQPTRFFTDEDAAREWIAELGSDPDGTS